MCIANNGVDIHIRVWRISLKSTNLSEEKGECSHVTECIDSRPLQASYPLDETPHPTHFYHKTFATAGAYFVVEKTSCINLQCFCAALGHHSRRVSTVMERMRDSLLGVEDFEFTNTY